MGAALRAWSRDASAAVLAPAALGQLARGRDLRPRDGSVDGPVPGNGQAQRHGRLPPVPHRNEGGKALAPSKALRRLRGSKRPEVTNTNDVRYHGVAVSALKKESHLPESARRGQAQRLSSIVEAGHGKLKRLIMPSLGLPAQRRLPTPPSRASRSACPQEGAWLPLRLLAQRSRRSELSASGFRPGPTDRRSTASPILPSISTCQGALQHRVELTHPSREAARDGAALLLRRD